MPLVRFTAVTSLLLMLVVVHGKFVYHEMEPEEAEVEVEIETEMNYEAHGVMFGDVPFRIALIATTDLSAADFLFLLQGYAHHYREIEFLKVDIQPGDIKPVAPLHESNYWHTFTIKAGGDIEVLVLRAHKPDEMARAYRERKVDYINSVVLIAPESGANDVEKKAVNKAIDLARKILIKDKVDSRMAFVTISRSSTVEVDDDNEALAQMWTSDCSDCIVATIGNAFNDQRSLDLPRFKKSLKSLDGLIISRMIANHNQLYDEFIKLTDEKPTLNVKRPFRMVLMETEAGVVTGMYNLINRFFESLGVKWKPVHSHGSNDIDVLAGREWILPNGHSIQLLCINHGSLPRLERMFKDEDGKSLKFPYFNSVMVIAPEHTADVQELQRALSHAKSHIRAKVRSIVTLATFKTETASGSSGESLLKAMFGDASNVVAFDDSVHSMRLFKDKIFDAFQDKHVDDIQFEVVRLRLVETAPNQYQATSILEYMSKCNYPFFGGSASDNGPAFVMTEAAADPHWVLAPLRSGEYVRVNTQMRHTLPNTNTHGEWQSRLAAAKPSTGIRNIFEINIATSPIVESSILSINFALKGFRNELVRGVLLHSLPDFGPSDKKGVKNLLTLNPGDVIDRDSLSLKTFNELLVSFLDTA